MIIGQSQVNLPLFGGTLVPSPDFIVTGLKTDPTGRSALSANWPAGIPAGTTFVFQSWILDGTGPRGFSASNGLQGTTK